MRGHEFDWRGPDDSRLLMSEPDGPPRPLVALLHTRSISPPLSEGKAKSKGKSQVKLLVTFSETGRPRVWGAFVFLLGFWCGARTPTPGTGAGRHPPNVMWWWLGNPPPSFSPSMLHVQTSTEGPSHIHPTRTRNDPPLKKVLFSCFLYCFGLCLFCRVAPRRFVLSPTPARCPATLKTWCYVNESGQAGRHASPLPSAAAAAAAFTSGASPVGGCGRSVLM